MQPVFRDFLIWLMGFVGVSAGVLLVGHLLARRYRARKANLHTVSGRDPLAAEIGRPVLLAMAVASAWLWAWKTRPDTEMALVVLGVAMLAAFCIGTLWSVATQRRGVSVEELTRLTQLVELAATWARRGTATTEALALAHAQLKQFRRPAAAPYGCRDVGEYLTRRLEFVSPGVAAQLRARLATEGPSNLSEIIDELHRLLVAATNSQARRSTAWVKYPLVCGLVPIACLLVAAPLTEWATRSASAPVESSADEAVSRRSESQVLTKPAP